MTTPTTTLCFNKEEPILLCTSDFSCDSIIRHVFLLILFSDAAAMVVCGSLLSHMCYLLTDNDTVHYSVSRSLDWPIFSLVDDDEALIKVNVDIIDLSHSVTDETDDTAFCQATIEFNSLDVIGQLLPYA